MYRILLLLFKTILFRYNLYCYKIVCVEKGIAKRGKGSVLCGGIGLQSGSTYGSTVNFDSGCRDAFVVLRSISVVGGTTLRARWG